MTACTRRAILLTVIGLGLLAAVVFILGFVNATAMIEESKRCAPTIWQLQWPKYTGCTMAAHEGLAGGLIGAAGAIWAAWLAYLGIQDQIAGERRAREQQRHDDEERGRQRHADAKRTAIVCLTPTVRAAAATLFSIEGAIAQDKESRSVESALTHLETTLNSFAIREAVRDLAVDDRIKYLEIVGLLSTLLSVGKYGASKPGIERYKVERSALVKLYGLLQQFDPGLAIEFAGVSKVRSQL